MATPSLGRARRHARWLAGASAVVPLVVLGAVLLLADSEAVPVFDPAVWRAQDGVVSGNRRSGMIADLEAGKLRVGMTREEVHTLLGPPGRFGPGYDSWGLGIGYFAMDYETYDVRYGPDGRVTGFGRVQG